MEQNTSRKRATCNKAGLGGVWKKEVGWLANASSVESFLGGVGES